MSRFETSEAQLFFGAIFFHMSRLLTVAADNFLCWFRAVFKLMPRLFTSVALRLFFAIFVFVSNTMTVVTGVHCSFAFFRYVSILLTNITMFHLFAVFGFMSRLTAVETSGFLCAVFHHVPWLVTSGAGSLLFAIFTLMPKLAAVAAPGPGAIFGQMASFQTRPAESLAAIFCQVPRLTTVIAGGVFNTLRREVSRLVAVVAHAR